MKKIFFAFLFLSQTGFAQINVTDGLKGYHPFNGNANSAYHFNGIDN